MSDNYYQQADSVEEYIQMAKDVNGAELIDRLKQYLPANSTVLEIGSGPGTDFQLLQQDYQVVGADFSAEFLKRLVAKYPDDEFLHLDATILATDRKFDGIYSNKVLQHLTDADLAQSIRRQAEILHPNGIICHSFWKGEGEEILKGLLVNYQTEESLRELFGGVFEVIGVWEYGEFEDGDSVVLVGRLG